MSERRFVLVDFTHKSSTRCLSVYEAGYATGDRPCRCEAWTGGQATAR
jgi:hypothetical protein